MNIDWSHPFTAASIAPALPGIVWFVVEDDGIEPTTPCLQSRCSPS